MILRSFFALLLLSLVTATASAQALGAPYNTKYTLHNLGSIAGLPSPYGGICFFDNNTLLIGGNANSPPAAIYKVPISRGAGNHITGFAGGPVLYKNCPNIEAGLTYGPGGDLFACTFPTNMLYQYLPGGGINPSKIINLTPAGVASSSGTCVFVPAGIGVPNPGGFRITSFSSSDFYTAGLVPDLIVPGCWNVVGVVKQTNTGGGPEGIIYVPPGSPIFNPANHYMIICEWSANQVAAYQLDVNGYPLPATQTLFIPVITGPEGAILDPLTNDMVFSTFNFGGDQVIVVEGFQPPTPPSTGSGEGSFAGVDPPAIPGAAGEGSFGSHELISPAGSSPSASASASAAAGGSNSHPVLAGPFVQTPGTKVGLGTPTPGFAAAPPAGTSMHVFNASFQNVPSNNAQQNAVPGGDALSWAILAGLALVVGVGLTKMNLTAGL